MQSWSETQSSSKGRDEVLCYIERSLHKPDIAIFASRHHYNTRSKAKEMAKSVSSQDSISELAELKEQMSEMFKILKALQSEKEKSTQTVITGPVGNPAQDPKSKPIQGADTSQRREEPMKWPLYGLPPNYVPPYENEIYEENPQDQFDAHMEQPAPQVDPIRDDEDPTYEPPPRATINRTTQHPRNSWTYHRPPT
ncbi:hypothetical protein Lal_00003777 [Lupinus albus]|nr:hypothetical protein Lal_00003777 [Lupinus albus]